MAEEPEASGDADENDPSAEPSPTGDAGDGERGAAASADAAPTDTAEDDSGTDGDGDAESDGIEADAESDDDGGSDDIEVDAESDGDGGSDGIEVDAESDGDGGSDDIEVDAESDGDGGSDGIEADDAGREGDAGTDDDGGSDDRGDSGTDGTETAGIEPDTGTDGDSDAGSDDGGDAGTEPDIGTDGDSDAGTDDGDAGADGTDAAADPEPAEEDAESVAAADGEASVDDSVSHNAVVADALSDADADADDFADSAEADADAVGEALEDDREDDEGSVEYVEDAVIDDDAPLESYDADDLSEKTGDFFDDGIFGEGPEEDIEMPLTAHIEEMMRRLSVVVAVVVVVMLVVYPVADQVINYLWNSHIPGAATITDRRPRVYGPLELILTELKVAGLAGFILGLPVFVYETYLFMKPGLYPRERRYYLAAVPTSLVLALVGVAFAHFVVLPAIFAYFTGYTVETAVVAFGLRDTFNLILILMGYMALVFQIPLLIQLAIMMNLVTRVWLEEKRLLFWGSFLGLAFLVSPDPTGMAPIIIAATMIGLFEGTLALLRWTGN